MTAPVRARIRRKVMVPASLAAAVMAAAPAAAQKPYALPSSPAFTFLDASPANVSRPTTARALATGLLNGISPDGRVQQGVAVDAAPWSLVPGLAIPLDQYRASRWKYALANTQLSLGTVRVAGDSADTDLAVGVRVTLFDRSDPMASRVYTDSLRRLMVTCLPTQPGQIEASVDCARQVTEKWRREWLNDLGNWNEPSLAVAAAGGWRLEESQVGDREWRGWAGWATGALPLGRGGQVVGQMRYDLARGDADGLSYGARAFYGSAVTNLFLEVTGDHRGPGSVGAEWSGGVEFRAAENLWLSTGFGTREPAGGERRAVVVADLRWELAQGPRLAR